MAWLATPARPVKATAALTPPDRIRERIYLAGGRAAQQRPHDDPKGTYSLFI